MDRGRVWKQVWKYQFLVWNRVRIWRTRQQKLDFAVVKFKRDKVPPKIIITRNYKQVDTRALQQDMENAPWSVINIFDDIDDAEYAFNTLYNNIIKANIPEKKVKVRSISLPWITSDIRKLMNKRYKLLQQAKKTQSEDLWWEFKKARNEVTRQLRTAEALYWKNEFAKTQNSRDVWNVVKKVKRQECKQNTIGPIRDDQDNIILEDSVKATLMNDYFSTIGENLMSTWT